MKTDTEADWAEARNEAEAADAAAENRREADADDARIEALAIEAEQAEQVRRTTIATEALERGRRINAAWDRVKPSPQVAEEKREAESRARDGYRGPRELAQHLYDSLMLDAWPRPAAVADWGITSADHLGALQDAIYAGATAADLDDCCGDGPAITAMVKAWQDEVGARYRVTFETVYDTWDSNEEE